MDPITPCSSQLVSPAGEPPIELPPSVHSLSRDDHLAPQELGHLSEYFDPFLPHFIADTLRCEGEVLVSTVGGRVDGLFLFNPVERIGSVFTRDLALAEAFSRSRRGIGVFSEFPLVPTAEVYDVLVTDGWASVGPHGYRHPVRAAREDDRPALLRLLQEVNGAVDERWLSPVEREGEKCLVVELEAGLVAAGWVSVVGQWGRLHSLSVRPGFRRMGVGADLWHARMLWARHAGAQRVLTEIAQTNVASRAISVAGGMRVWGPVYLTVRP